MNQQAIEAAAIKLFDFIHCQDSGEALDWHTEIGEGYRDDYRRHVVPILEAALPHIREQLAQDVLDGLKDFSSNGLPYRNGIYAGYTSAARIVEGKQ